MDKQKQIEEMAKVVQRDTCGDRPCEECNYHGKMKILPRYCGVYLIAEKLYNAGYRKIPEGAVVLTREEYEKLKLFKERVRSGVCFTQKEWFDYCQKDSNERTSLLIKAKIDARKKTAEKLLDEIDYESNGQTKSITDLLRKKYGV